VRRELAIALRAPATWLAASLGALLVGHGFVLATDLYTSASRAALGYSLLQRQIDPLAGLVRPLLGAQLVAAVLVGPVSAARVLAVDKERGTYAMHMLEARSPVPVVARAAVAALAATALLALPALALLALSAALGAHFALVESSVAFLGHALVLVLVASVGVAAAAWCRTAAQATTLTIAVLGVSWIVDAGRDFAALAWVRALDVLSMGRRLEAFEGGIVSLGSLLWFASATAGAFGLALVGAGFELRSAKTWKAGAVVGAVLVLLSLSTRVARGFDLTEARRASLAPAEVAALRAVPAPIRLEVFYDRDDARRMQLERDVIAKLVLARPDVVVEMPLDDRPAAVLGEREEGYGRVVVHVGPAERETRSSDLVAAIFDAVGQPMPDDHAPEYPGYPWVAEGAMRTGIVIAAYAAVPALFLALGMFLVKGRTS
jgi:hypothetical protein